MSKGNFLNIQWSILTPSIVLVVLGLTTLFSVNISFFKSQLIFLIISIFAYVFFCNVNYKIIQMYSLPIYIFSLIILFIVLILGIESRGAMRWIDVFGIRVQFSELLKPFLAISFSFFLSKSNNSFKNFLQAFIFLFLVVFLIFAQPDLGNAVIYIIVALSVLIVVGFPYLWFVFGGIASVVFLPVFWHFLHGYQKQRIFTFFSPSNDPLGTSYNAIQSIVSVGSGMVSGKGLGEGTQSMLRFLPERHTDFIFATFSEEFGLIGALVLILTFSFLLYKLYSVFEDSNERFCKIFVVCSFFLILVQFFVNIGMNIGLLPVVGVTLPFVSYGGSSLLSNFILLGLVSSINSSLKSKNVLEIK